MAIPRIDVGNVIQVVMRGKANGQVNLNVLHYVVTKRPETDQYGIALTNLADQIAGVQAGTLTSAMINMMGTNCTLDNVQLQRVSPQRSLYIQVPIGQDGLNPSQVTAQNVAAVITKQVERAGRGRVGSFHMGYVPPVFYVNGNLTAAAVPGYQAVANFLQKVIETPVDAGEYTPVTFDPNAPLPERTNIIVNCFPQITLRVMRRRTVGLGI